ncbi:uncharacterized protein LOC141911033 [Tubulanus polymorphus]|uniref:uncharacterized protein LOC141911033 n=1 Tax=Tubulanus polymorphus TaxID=672921 RepID=UPI003DA47774
MITCKFLQTDDCEDNHGSCAQWAKDEECKKNPVYMLINCKKSCELCKQECKDESKSCTSWAIQGKCYEKPFQMMFKCQKACKVCGKPNPDCLDNNVQCPEWARQGECLKNPKYMLLQCKDSCHMCKPECKDENQLCTRWAIFGECYENPSYMMFKCQKACKVCGQTNPNCLDEHAECPEWARQGECLKNPKYMLLKCKDSCHVCKAECKDESKSCKRWAIDGGCFKNPYYMMYHCQETCEVCSKQCKETLHADIVFVLDASSSVKNENFEKMLDFVRKVVSDMPIGPEKVRVALVRYSDKKKVDVVFYLNDYSTAADLVSAIGAVRYTGGLTYTAKALKIVRKKVLETESRQDAKHLVVIITDGKASDKKHLPKAIKKLHKTGATVIAVGVGSEIDDSSLESMASPPKAQNKIQVSDFNQLTMIMDEVKITVCE